MPELLEPPLETTGDCTGGEPESNIELFWFFVVSMAVIYLCFWIWA
jgi:hypothetical protein